VTVPAAPALTVASPENPETHDETPAETTTQKRKGHGRRAARDCRGAKLVTCVHQELNIGGACPLTDCAGKLYDTVRPQEFIQWVGHPPLTATRYEQQVLRCGHCQQRFAAELPAGVTPQKYDETADVALVFNKFGLMTPWTRLAGIQQLCELPLAEATQCEMVTV
jgi:hypothetical protein